MNPETSTLNYNGSLPETYSEDRLVLLPRDPNWLFSYWEISPESRKIMDYHGVGTPLLRVKRFDFTGEKIESYFDLEITPGAGNWYINAGYANHRYQVELGWPAGKGDFFTLLKSNIVQTPPDSISPREDEEWMLPSWRGKRLYRRLARSSMSSFEFFLWSQRQRQKSFERTVLTDT